MRKQKASKGILWKVFLAIFGLIFFAVMELGKHTVLGWVLTAVLIAAFAFAGSRLSKLEKGRKGRFFLSWIVLFVLFAGVVFLSWPPERRVPAVSHKNPDQTKIITVEQGQLRGVLTKDSKVEIFAGIPYAKPPVGELRWKEPVPADKWDGVLKADTFAPMSMQTRDLPIYSSLARIIGFHDYKFFDFTDNYREPASEDSLYLNIWRPAGSSAGDKLPVMVYIHGGSLQTGQPWYADYSGEGLAREGVIVVNMHYRLGVFGFFADEELAAESPNHTTGNYGLLDQILALKWVQSNIAAFGGDPSNVTVSGESAGSACVSALCTSPLAKGLFRRVLMESSTVSAPAPAHSFRLLDAAYRAAKATKEKFGAASIAELRAVPAEKIVGELSTHHHITVDGYVLKETPYESYAKGIHNEEAQLHGFNRDEAAPFIMFSQGSMKNYESRVRAYFKDQADAVLKLYPSATDAEARRNWTDLDSAILFTYGHYCLARQAKANSIPSYTYYFTKDNGYLGTWHSGEEVYFYGNIPEGSRLFDARDRELSAQIVKYVVNYMKTGDPNGSGLPAWTSGDPDRIMEFGVTTGMQTAPYLELYKAMDQLSGFKKD